MNVKIIIMSAVILLYGQSLEATLYIENRSEHYMQIWTGELKYKEIILPPAATNNTYPISKWPYNAKDQCITLTVTQCLDDSCRDWGGAQTCSVDPQAPNGLLIIKNFTTNTTPILICPPSCNNNLEEDETNLK